MSLLNQDEPLRKTPVYGALMRPRLTWGVDTDIVESLGIVTIFFVLSPIRFYYFPVISFTIWLLVYLYAADDPDALRILRHYSKQGDRYEPWPHAGQRCGLRPAGFGRDELC